MKKWLRRIRGAVGMGLTWAIAWFGAGLVLLLIAGFGAADVPFPLLFALLGFLAGVTFSGILGIVEGRRRFDQMSLPRFAVWGGIGGLLLSGIFVLAAALGGDVFLVLGPIFALSGAGSAAGSLALARMGEDRGLLDARTDVGEPGLTEDEARELLRGGG
ncbi:MAG: hypothetical protein AMS21_05385 [Gemmatimonas sp. SG8_38_2]|nr:MAG: hypothetical protein AMS21_05385 [Gemmatimonas sp. SG8_38_2]